VAAAKIIGVIGMASMAKSMAAAASKWRRHQPERKMRHNENWRGVNGGVMYGVLKASARKCRGVAMSAWRRRQWQEGVIGMA